MSVAVTRPDLPMTRSPLLARRAGVSSTAKIPRPPGSTMASAPPERRKSRCSKQRDKASRTRRRQRSKSTPASVNVDNDTLDTSLNFKRLPLPARLPSLNLSKMGSRSLTKLGLAQQQRWQDELELQPQQQQQQMLFSEPRGRARRPSLHTEKSTLSLGNGERDENARPASCSAKKAKKPSLLSCVKPDNVEEEKEKFMKSRFTHNPQFLYRNPAAEGVLEKFNTASPTLLPMAKQILRTALRKHGTFEKFMEKIGGRKLNRLEIMDVTRKYLREEGLDNEISIQLSETLVPRACMTRVRGQPTLQVKVGDIREFWVDGMLRHEIGTHYVRSCNNRHQIWQSSKKRRQLQMQPINPTEEGLASLHSVIFRNEPCMWRSACLYYTVYQASTMSFVDLFRDLGQYIKDPESRWDYCVRAKRGMTDTSFPGTFNKDQVYLIGALNILKYRHEIDFDLLYRCGKVCFRDLDKLRDLVDRENTRLPRFLNNMKKYREALDDILVKNGLTDEDLDTIA